MNNNIKRTIEEYVMEEFEYLKRLDTTEDEYNRNKECSIKSVNTLVELLQKEDVNFSNSKNNEEKLLSELEKYKKEHEINLKKIECEIEKNRNNFDLEKEKIEIGNEIDNKKIENDIAKINNDIVKINKDYELGERKIQCDIDNIKNDVTKINNEYEINRDKIQIEINKNEDTIQIENRKIDSAEIKNNSDSDLKKEELKMNAKREIELRNDRIIKVLVDGATVIVPIVFYNVWMNKGFKFEETGTYCSNTFKNLISKFKPTR